jgi:hypothetical protein
LISPEFKHPTASGMDFPIARDANELPDFEALVTAFERDTHLSPHRPNHCFPWSGTRGV